MEECSDEKPIKLECTKKVVFATDYSDVENLIKKVYGHDYEIMPMEEVGSSQYAATYTQNVSKMQLSDHEVEEVNGLRNGKPHMFSLNAILSDMCNMGYIEPGEYIIDVNW